jgi:dipeptidyl aminopeptidase/acylaminoacyl peptidase
MPCRWTLARSSSGLIEQSFSQQMTQVFLVVAGMLLAATVVGAIVLRRIYHVPRTSPGVSPRLPKLPFSTESIPAGEGCHLAAWYVPVSVAHAPGAVLLHGWGQTAESLYPLIAPLHEAGLAVLLIDARHHGASVAEGQPSLRQFADDMLYALDWLSARPDVDGDRLFAVGHSIGGAAALLAGSVDPRIAGVISISSFSHSVTHLRRELRSCYIPYWPLGRALILYKQLRQGFCFDSVAPVNSIAEISAPVLLVHARDDAEVPLSDALAIYELRRDDRVRLLVLDRGGHYPLRALRRAPGAVAGFIDTCLSRC